LRPVGLSIARLKLSGRHAWRLRVDTGTVVQLGVDDFDKRLRRFAKVYPKLKAKWKSEIESVDLRYANGMAVQWADKTIGMGSKS